MQLSLKMAWRFLTSAKAQTALIVIGIAVGISVQIFVGLLIQGLQKDLLNQAIGSSSQITIAQVNDDNFTLDSSLTKELNDNSSITKVSPILTQNVFVDYSSEHKPLLLNGMNFDDKSDIYNLKDKLVSGVLPTGDNEIILGSYFKDNIKLNDTVSVISFNKQPISYKVVGFFDYKVQSANKTFAYTKLSSMQNNLGLENQVTDIEMQLNKPMDSALVAKTIHVDTANFSVTTWQTANASLLTGISGQSSSSIMIQVFVMISVVLAIASVLIISVVQKQKQIGILKAMGLNDGNTAKVFLFQGLILGVLGAVLGIVLGLILLKAFTTFAVTAEGTPVVNIYYEWWYLAMSFAIGVISAVVASLIPARKSKKLTVMEVISNG